MEMTEEHFILAEQAFENERFNGMSVIGSGKLQASGNNIHCSVHLQDGDRDLLAVYTVEFEGNTIVKTRYELI